MRSLFAIVQAHIFKTRAMINQRWLFLIGLALSSDVLLIGCSKSIHGGDPALPLSNTNGTTRIFPVPENVILVAISNAFATSDDNPDGYRGMDLSPAAQFSYLVPNWHPTNGFVLFPLIGPITNVPLSGQPPASVPYKACFNIATTSMNGSNTSVTVRTIYAKVIDGKEVGVHGGWANHERDVPPVKAEEENVLNAVSNALVAPRVPEKPNR
jgi:hypothetical protein